MKNVVVHCDLVLRPLVDLTAIDYSLFVLYFCQLSLLLCKCSARHQSFCRDPFFDSLKRPSIALQFIVLIYLDFYHFPFQFEKPFERVFQFVIDYRHSCEKALVAL